MLQLFLYLFFKFWKYHRNYIPINKKIKKKTKNFYFGYNIEQTHWKKWFCYHLKIELDMFKKLLKIFVFYYWPFVNWAIFKKVHFLDLKKLSIFSYNVLQCNVYQMYYYIKEICKLHPLIYKTCQKLVSLFSYATKYYFRRVSQKLPKMPGGTCFYFRYLSKACGFFLD